MCQGARHWLGMHCYERRYARFLGFCTTELQLRCRYGDVRVEVGATAHASSYGVAHNRSTIAAFVRSFMSQSASSARPPCVFDAHVMAARPELVEFAIPRSIVDIGASVMAQLGLGPELSGSHAHFHGDAVNVVVRIACASLGP